MLGYLSRSSSEMTSKYLNNSGWFLEHLIHPFLLDDLNGAM